MSPAPTRGPAPANQPHLVFDTGPLLCLGGSRELRAAVVPRYRHNAHWVDAVLNELRNLASRPGHIGIAAGAASGTHSTWLPRPVSFSQGDATDLTQIIDRLHNLADIKNAQRGKAISRRGNTHLGEAQSILHARRYAYHLVSHDEDAKRVAVENNVQPLTIVTLARTLVADRASAKLLAGSLITLSTRNIDIGETVRGELDLMPPRKPRLPPS